MTSGFDVSTEIGIEVCFASASITGTMRRDFFLRGNRLGSGPRGFAADIEQIGAFLDQFQTVRDRGRRIELPAAVGKRIGRDVDDARDARTIERERTSRAIDDSGEIEHAREFNATRAKNHPRRSGDDLIASSVEPQC